MNQKTKNLVGAGVFTAIVLVLQFLGGTFQIGGLNINVSLVPIVVGAAIYGWKVGAWLGLMSGGVILVAGQAAAFLPVNPLGTVITVLVKGTLCGLIAGLVYTALCKKNQWLAIIVAAIVCPVVNTGVFLLGCTELPLAAEAVGLTVPVVDPTAELAKAAIRFCGFRVRAK